MASQAAGTHPAIPSSLDRALAAGNWPARRPDGSFAVASSSRAERDHIVSADGSRCSCEAGRHGRPDCLHRAAVRRCLANGIWAAYIVCPNCREGRVAKRGRWCPSCIRVARTWAESYAAMPEHHRPPSLARFL